MQLTAEAIELNRLLLLSCVSARRLSLHSDLHVARVVELKATQKTIKRHMPKPSICLQFFIKSIHCKSSPLFFCVLLIFSLVNWKIWKFYIWCDINIRSPPCFTSRTLADQHIAAAWLKVNKKKMKSFFFVFFGCVVCMGAKCGSWKIGGALCSFRLDRIRGDGRQQQRCLRNLI